MTAVQCGSPGVSLGLIYLKRWLHLKHKCGLCPVWIICCLFRSPLLLKRWPHSEQQCYFCSVCIILCLFRYLVIFNYMSHSEHECGFYPVCIILCGFSSLVVLNGLHGPSCSAEECRSYGMPLLLCYNIHLLVV